MSTFNRPPHAHKSGGLSALIPFTLGAALVLSVACESPKRELLSAGGVSTPEGGALLPPMTAEPMAGEPMAGEPMAGEPMAGEPVAGEPMAGEPMAGEPMAGEPVAGEPVAGEPIGGMPSVEPPEDCLSNEDFFEQRVWREVLKPTCFDCHNQQGAALTSEMVFVRDELPGALEQNYEAFSHIAAFDQSGYPLVLLKPTNRLPHGGGELIVEGDASYELLSEMVERTRDPEPVVCTPEEVEGVPSIFEGVTLLGPHETLRRAVFSLSGRLPSASEEALVTSHGWGGLEQALEGVFMSEGFDRRLKEIWNDILLTDKYLGGTEAIDLLNPTTYPTARWFMGGASLGEPVSAAEFWAASDFSNDSLAREALEHIAFVVREGRPFTEVITSDYIAMNPFTAKMYGVTDIEWDNPLNPREYREGRAPGIPHAGILTSPMFLNRYPTTDTNRNRHRARIFYKLFLDLDIFKVAERPIDPTSTAHNPTMNDPQCAMCHTVMDPVAGAFQHWDASGSFMFRDTWYGDMRAPGFGQELLPYEERTASLRWLAEQAAADEGFDRAITRHMYQALVGGDLLTAPTTGEHLEARVLAFEEQQAWVDQVARGFRANGHDLHWLIKAIVRSPYFRAQGLEDPTSATPERLAQLEHLGLNAPLTPEQLNRKLISALGIKWRSDSRRDDSLVNSSEYRLLYGGIDSDDVVERIRTPNGIFANIQRRMANEVACRVTAFEFTKPAEERLILPLIEPTFVPEDDNGFEVPQARQRIRDNLKYLAWRLWGERLADDSAELDELEDVWTGAWRLGRAAIDEGRVSESIDWQCQGRWDPSSGEQIDQDQRVYRDPRYVIRAWEATLTFFINDYAFLYE